MPSRGRLPSQVIIESVCKRCKCHPRKRGDPRSCRALRLAQRNLRKEQASNMIEVRSQFPEVASPERPLSPVWARAVRPRMQPTQPQNESSLNESMVVPSSSNTVQNELVDELSDPGSPLPPQEQRITRGADGVLYYLPVYGKRKSRPSSGVESRRFF